MWLKMCQVATRMLWHNNQPAQWPVAFCCGWWPVSLCCGDRAATLSFVASCWCETSKQHLFATVWWEDVVLGVPQMLLATFNFCSVSLMIIFNYHLLFLQPTIGCLLPVATTNNNVGNDVDISKLLTSRGHHPMATFSPTNSGVDATWLTALHCHSSMQLEEKTKNNKNQLGTQRKKSKSSWAATMVLGCSIFGVWMTTNNQPVRHGIGCCHNVLQCPVMCRLKKIQKLSKLMPWFFPGCWCPYPRFFRGKKHHKSTCEALHLLLWCPAICLEEKIKTITINWGCTEVKKKNITCPGFQSWQSMPLPWFL